MAIDDVLVLGESIERRDRTLKSGAVKTRYVINVKSDKLVISTDARALAAAPAKALAKMIRERLLAISDVAAPNTLRARATAARAFAAGKAWALKRYAGGKLGDMAPAQSDRKFNDSGRLAKSIVATANAEGATVNVAANRLSPGTLDGRGLLGGDGALARVFEMLRVYVPELDDPASFLDSIPVRKAVNDALDAAVRVAKGNTLDVALELVELGVEALAALDEIAAG